MAAARRDQRVLDVGTGSGYQAAVLARLCREVYTVELRPALLRGAEERFGSLGLTNIHTRLGDGRRGWPDAAPFEAIVTAAASAAPPEALLGQLSAGGRIVLPIGPPDGQRLIRVRRTLDGGFAFDGGIPVCFVALHPSDVTPRG